MSSVTAPSPVYALPRALIALALVLAPQSARAQPGKVRPAPSPAQMPAVIDDALTIGGEDIGGKKVATRMTVAVEVNGRGPFHFVVDSGADTSVIGMRAARALQLPPTTPVMLHGVTASGMVDRVAVDQLVLGQSTISELQLPVLADVDLGAAGMIGIDALVEQRLMLDFDKRVIKVEDAHKKAQTLDGEIVVTARRRRGQLILTEARANGRRVDAVIDTGSEITIGNVALRDQLIRRWGNHLTSVEAIGVTGVSITLQMARIAEIRLGPVILRDVPIAFADVPPFAVFGLSKEPALLLGTDLMETFRRVSLDFRARKVRFQLRQCGSHGIIVSTSNSVSRIAVADQGMAACKG